MPTNLYKSLFGDMPVITIDTLLHPQQILTLTGSCLEEHSLAIHEGKILAILPRHQALEQYHAKQSYQLSNHLIMPGLVNTHTHISMNLLKGLADDLKVLPWLENHIWPAEAAVITPKFVVDGARLAMAEMIRGGITTFNDTYFYAEDMAKLADEVGIRAVLSETFFKFSTPWSPNSDASFARTKDLLAITQGSKTLKTAIFPHAPYSTDIPLLEKIAAFAQEHDLLIHTHLLESQHEIDECIKEFSKTPVELWHELGIIGPKTIAAHMTKVNDNDLAVFKQTGASVVHCPESNMKLASGVCPVQKMIDLGINLALGTDGAASNNDLDMFGEMKSAAFLAKVSSDNPEALNAKTVLEMATINGAKALHWDKEIGTLAVGKMADIIAIDMNTIDTQPCFNPISQLVYATPRHQVSHVWVNGKILMDNRALTTLDEAAILANAKEWQQTLKTYAL